MAQLENPIAKHPLSLGDFRRITAGLPDATPIFNDVVEGPDQWTAGIISVECGIPKAWQGVQAAVAGVYIHISIRAMDGEDDESCRPVRHESSKSQPTSP